jgi:hypothetical protein
LALLRRELGDSSNEMNRSWLIVLGAVLGLVTACKKKPPAPTGPDCNYTHEGTPRFCMKSPAGFTAGAEFKNPAGHIYMHVKDATAARDLELQWGGDTAASGHEDRVRGAQTMAQIEAPKGTVVGYGDLPNGGYWFEHRLPNQGNAFSGQVYAKGPTGALECSFFTKDEGFAKDAAEACKSIHVY